MAAVDLRPRFGPVEQQGSGNACVAHAATSALEATLGVADLSRLFVYWNARSYAGQTGGDYGCQPRNAVKGITQYGAPAETAWPYDYTKVTVQPSATAYQSALGIRPRVKEYRSITSFDSMRSAMLAGLPVIFGMVVPDTFVSVAKPTGYLPMWTSTTKWIGRHAMCTAGFDDAKGTVIVRNSFGPTWGSQGYFEMPYGWFSTLSSTSKVSDCWAFIPA